MAPLNYDALYPEYLRDGVKLYIEQGCPPGGFLTAVIKNDLVGACSRADIECAALLHKIVCWWWNEAPGPCWGSEDRMIAWVAARQAVGLGLETLAIECGWCGNSWERTVSPHGMNLECPQCNRMGTPQFPDDAEVGVQQEGG